MIDFEFRCDPWVSTLSVPKPVPIAFFAHRFRFTGLVCFRCAVEMNKLVFVVHESLGTISFLVLPRLFMSL